MYECMSERLCVWGTQSRDLGRVEPDRQNVGKRREKWMMRMEWDIGVYMYVWLHAWTKEMNPR